MTEPRTFWTDYQPGFRTARHPVGSREFFHEATANRYSLEPHIPEVVGFERWAGRQVLEAGCGIGTDGARFAAAGARYTGLDFSPTALVLARRRFEFEGLPGRFVLGSATGLPFADATFDLVFSHGVIHHLMDTEAAVREFHRVLRPGGRALVMVYHRRSFNYVVSIMGVRRALAAVLVVPGMVRLASRLTGEPVEVLSGHRTLVSTHGARYLLDRKLFLAHNTDGPGNPLSKAYSRSEVTRLFSPGFHTRTHVRYLNLRLYPGASRVIGTPLGNRLERHIGWHLYVDAVRHGT